jgi:hypothetical protein
MIDERGGGAQRFLADDLARLALGADEQDAALFEASWRTNFTASWYIARVFSRLMMWILLRWPKINGAILGFQ